MTKLKFAFTALLIIALMPSPASALIAPAFTQQAAGPVYIIQSGDTMSTIASRFGLTLDEISAANPNMNINAIAPGDQVVIPGLEGINGVLTTQTVTFGETLDSLSRKNGLNKDFLIKLNHITNPAELYVGIGLIVPVRDDQTPREKPSSMTYGGTILETAATTGGSVYTVLGKNGLEHTWDLLPGEIIFSEGQAPEGTELTFSDMISSFAISSFPIIQGGTAVINIATDRPVELTGSLVDKPLKFAKVSDTQYIALQGVHALLDPGPYPLRLNITDAEGERQSFEQMVLVGSGYYPDDPILIVDSATIDPTQNDTEFERVVQLTSGFTEPKMWEGVFANPSIFPDCFTSGYGNRRLYQGEGTKLEYRSFHSGLDFCGGEGLAITAPADGTVLMAELTTIRGNATLIDHGWGVYSGIWHQSQILVQPGQHVTKGEVIGYVGGTGRVTGAHLHWEVWVNGIQVNPMDWLTTVYP